MLQMKKFRLRNLLTSTLEIRILIISKSQGHRLTVKKVCDEMLKIPMAGSIFSSLAKATSGQNHALVT